MGRLGNRIYNLNMGFSSFMKNYVLVTLKKGDESIYLFMQIDVDLSIVTEHAGALFKLSEATTFALANIYTDDVDFSGFMPMIGALKKVGVIGFPIDARDARMYALNNGYDFEELEIVCG